MLYFFSYNIQHYGEMKKLISEKLLEMQQSGVRRVVFFGVSDEMEIAYITLQGSDMKLVRIADEDGKKRDETSRPQSSQYRRSEELESGCHFDHLFEGSKFVWQECSEGQGLQWNQNIYHLEEKYGDLRETNSGDRWRRVNRLAHRRK